MENIETLLAAVAQTQGFDFDESTSPDLGLRNSPEIRRETELDGGAVVASPAEVMIGDVDKKKRGRPARGQLGARIPAPKRKKEEDEDEDVCFICFDGGSLVLCDRKGCPKAYHPACIKRDEKFFQSKAKWTCGWHICSVCRKASHYLCYTCTYSLCKACTKDADYVCVRRNKGFCSTCMKTIMLLENKGQTDNDSVQVDFDDKLSWEYLFKVYWVYVKEKLSLTVNDLRRAKNPWKGVTPATGKVQISNAHYNAANGKVSISYDSPLDLEKNKPHEEVSFPQNERLRTSASGTNNLLDAKEENAPCQNKVTENPSMDRVSGPNIDNGSGEADVDKAADKPNIEKDGDNSSTVKDDKPHIEKDGDSSSIVKDTDKPVIEERDNSSMARDTDRPCICRNRDEPRDQCPDNLGIDSGSEWASKDLLEFVAHMKNGDTSAVSQFDVQTLLLDYIKKNNLRDPRRKSQIICDLRLSNLFGKPRVGHIEMLKLLEFHFLVKDTQKNSFIPAGLVGPSASDLEVDGNKCGSSMPINSRKRKSRKKSEERVTQDNLNEYAAIDFHNINLIYLRRNLMEDLIEDKENFNDKVVGSIVRIRISTNDQKPEIYRLVQVVGTSKGPESYKIGDKTADIMLEVLNLDKKEAVSVDSLSNQEFTEDECRRLRQSIRCGLMKQFTVGELQKKAMELQPVRVNDWLKAEILKLNHLRDLASEKGRKKELRECIQKLQLLKSPEERQRRVSEVPYIHADPKMNPNYESEEEARSGDTIKKDENLQQSHSVFTQNGRKTISSNKRGKKDSSVRAQNSVVVRTDAGGSRNSEKQTNQVNATKSAISCGIDQAAQRSGVETSTAIISVGNSSSANSIETEKLWHYRDPNAKIQGPFSMMQLRKWNTTGLFPPDMRIWTNHEQYDSLLLTDALNGYFHGASKLPVKHTSAEEHIQIGVSEGANGTGEDGKQTETALSNSTSVLSDDKTGSAVMDKSSSPAQPQCLDLNKNKNPSASDVQARNILSPSSLNVQAENGNSSPSLQQTNLCNRVSGLSDGDTESVMTDKSSSAAQPQCLDLNTDKNSCASDVQACNVLSSSSLNVQAENGHSSPSLQQTTLCNHLRGLSDGNTESVMTDKSSSAAQPRCLDLNTDKNSSASDVQACNVLSSSSLNVQAENGHSSSSLEQTDLFNRMSGLCGGNTGSMMTDKSSSPAQPQCLDLNIDKNFSASDVQARSMLSSSSLNVQAEDGHSPSSLEQTALCNNVSGLPDGNTVSETTDKSSSPAQPQCLDLNMDNNSSASDVQPRDVLSSSSLHVQADNEHSSSSLEQTGLCNRVSGLSDGNAVSVMMDKLSSPTQPQCLDLNIDNNFSASDVQAHNVLSSSSHDGQVDNEHSSSGLEHNSIAPPDPGKESGEVKKCSQSAEKDSSAQIQNHVSRGDELQNQSNYHGQTLLFSEEKLRSLTIELFSNDIESDSAIESIPESAVAAVIRDIDIFNFPSPTPETSDKHTGVQTTENQQSISSDVPVQSSCILELLSPMPRSNIEDQKCYTNETNHSQITDFLVSNHGPSSSNPSSLVVGTQLPEVGDEWFGYSPTPAKLSVQEWDFALGPPQVTSENVTTSTVNNDQQPHASNLPSWMFMDGPIEFDALGEESVSDLLAEVDAMESQGNFPSPTSAMKFAKELIEDCKDECFSSIEFNPIPYPAKTDAMSSTGENQSTSQAPMPYKSIGDALDSFRRSDVHSSTSSMGETNASGYSGESASEFHPPAPNNTNQEVIRGSEHMDPGWGTVQGNINLVTVQGNVNLVLGGPGQGMPNINWGANPGSGWVNPNMNNRYGGERYTSPREWGYQGGEAGFGRGRAPWGRQPYGGGGGGGGGGYLRPPPKGQRVCKFYETGRCRKGAFCDYLHPS